LNSHQGLSFLRDESFRKMYSETVIVRIFYTVNQSKSEKISIGEFKKSELLDVFNSLETMVDINKVFLFYHLLTQRN
jgi:serine/threonine-protein phosphatase 2A regulatory subunit B''